MQHILYDFEGGYRSTVYDDGLGNATIGIGFNLDDPTARAAIEALGLDYDALRAGTATISREDADTLFYGAISSAESDVVSFLGSECLGRLTPCAQDIVAQMAFQMGRSSLSGFNRMRAALCDGGCPDFDTAADEMLNSRWARETPSRASVLAGYMRDADGDCGDSLCGTD